MEVLLDSMVATKHVVTNTCCIFGRFMASVHPLLAQWLMPMPKGIYTLAGTLDGRLNDTLASNEGCQLGQTCEYSANGL